MSFLHELRRRNVIRIAAGYIVAAWLVVQVVETIFPAFGFGDEAIRFVVIAFAVLFIPVVVMAWVFEWTPEGIKKDQGIEDGRPDVAAAAKRWDRIVMVILALAVAFFIVENILERPTEIEPTIVVLPFETIGSGPETGYLAAGVAEGVHRSLARIPELIVSAWATAVELQQQGLAAEEIADRLKAPNFLTGTVQKAGDSIRVEARLVLADTGRAVWSETYDGPMADVFAIQDEIAAAVVSTLRIGGPGAAPRAQRTNPETSRLTMQAWSILHRESRQDTGQIARALAEEALTLDPRYVPALTALGFSAFAQQQAGTISASEAAAVYEDVKERVLSIDPDDGTANVYLAWELFWDRAEVAHANQHLQIALRTGLNDLEVLRVLAGFARRTGKVDAAIRLGERALLIDPTCENCQWQQSENLFYAGRFPEAIAAKTRLQALVTGGFYNHAVMLLAQDEPEAALQLVAAMEGRSPEQALSIRAMAHHAMGDAGQYRAALAALEQLEGYAPREGMAQVYAFTGEFDRAFELLESLAEHQAQTLKSNVFLPQWRSLHDDPRWPALRQRLDMSRAQLEALDFSRFASGAP